MSRKAIGSQRIAREVLRIFFNTTVPVYITLYFIAWANPLVTTGYLPTNPLTILLEALLITAGVFNMDYNWKEKDGVITLIVSYVISATLVCLLWPQIAIRVTFLKPEINWIEASLLSLPARLYVVTAKIMRKQTDQIYKQISNPRFNRWSRIAIEITRVSMDTWLPTAIITAFIFWFANIFTSAEIIIPAELPRIIFTSIIATAIGFDLWYTEYKIPKEKAIIRVVAIITSFVIAASIVFVIWPIATNGVSYFQPNISWGVALLLCFPARLYMLLSGMIITLTE